ncbi:hypothetical protein NA78x_002904 [Anatilimnocola sp. NA78]|uniref:hypothetical protein n=1 Tax=Anatilimnocola sp. NA78 TaxID=3415683 RepID=UPI003CE5201A
MKIYLALYDPAFQAADGTYWTWHHPVLSLELLAQTYYEGLAADLPPDPSALTESVVWGGMVDVNREWRCYYRFLDGGRDTRGRPGRYVVLCGFVPGRELATADPGELFQGQLIEDVAMGARTECPIKCRALEIQARSMVSAQYPEVHALVELDIASSSSNGETKTCNLSELTALPQEAGKSLRLRGSRGRVVATFSNRTEALDNGSEAAAKHSKPNPTPWTASTSHGGWSKQSSRSWLSWNSNAKLRYRMSIQRSSRDGVSSRYGSAIQLRCVVGNS